MFLFMKQKLFDSAADSRRQEYRTQIPDFRAGGRSKVESRGSRAESSRDSRGAVITAAEFVLLFVVERRADISGILARYNLHAACVCSM